MADSTRRSVHKVTFTSIRPSDEDVRSGATERRRRGLDKIAFVSALRATAAEIAAVQATAGDDPLVKQGLAAVLAAASATRQSRNPWQRVVRASTAELVAAGRALANHRRNERAALSDSIRVLVAEHVAHVRREAERSSSGPTTAPAPASPPSASRSPSDPDAVRPSPSRPPSNPWRPEPAADPRMHAAPLRSTLRAAIDHARVTMPGRLDHVVAQVQRLAGIDAAAVPGLGAGEWDHVVETIISTGEDVEDWTDDLIDGFEERMNVEPIGRVHLERIDMSPVGVERGELLHSVGLAPRETVTLIHREWSSRETSFEKVVSDEFEQSTEEGVTENTELASATEVQSRHSSELSVEATASGSYGFASGSVTVGYGSTSEDESAKQDSRNHSVSITRKASSRTKQEHKSTFTVKETAGVEDQSVRTLSNPSDTEPMRIDFHQLLRKWQVDLYRHGVRLTYDVVVPAPGIDLLENLDELRRVDHVLAQPFVFDVVPSAITRASWLELAARHGAQIEAPPSETVQVRLQQLFGNATADEADRMRIETFELDIPEGYRVARCEFLSSFVVDPGGWFDVLEDPPGAVVRHPDADAELLSYRSGLENLHGRRGRVGVIMALYKVRAGHAQLTLESALGAELWHAWQHNAWGSLRRAAEEQWQARRQELRQRRDQLAATIGAWDPLSLRKMEREEVMKTTLKWIFGPAFDLMPGEVARRHVQDDGGIARLEPSRLTAAQWAQVMGRGEFLKFLQQAIEWENVLFFVYPYFWDHPRNHKLKRFLAHPDSLHRAFLRGGAARVVLTVRPGFEESFTRLFETGTLDDELERDHPYLTIAQEIRAYAATHYPGLPGLDATPEEAEAAERGVHIGRWFEYTPISATDISVNTPLDQLK